MFAGKGWRPFKSASAGQCYPTPPAGISTHIELTVLDGEIVCVDRKPQFRGLLFSRAAPCFFRLRFAYVRWQGLAHRAAARALAGVAARAERLLV